MNGSSGQWPSSCCVRIPHTFESDSAGTHEGYYTFTFDESSGWYFTTYVVDWRDLETDDCDVEYYWEEITVYCDQGAKVNGYPTCVNLDGNPDDIATCMFCACIDDPPRESRMQVGTDNCMKADFSS